MENRIKERIQQAIQNTSELTPSESTGVAFHMTDWLGDLDRFEPPRLYRRLHILRGWSYELTKTIFPRSPGASCSISP